MKNQAESKHQLIDLSSIKTIPLEKKNFKVKVADFASVLPVGGTFSQFIQSLPNILAAKDFKTLVAAIVNAHRQQKPVIWGFGGHVIKCGLAPVIIELLKKGVITVLTLNGAGIIHDVEVAMVGKTSEDVSIELADGSFGMAEETGHFINTAITAGAASNIGIGKSVAAKLVQLNPPFISNSILANAYKLGVPITVHVAMGTDTIHFHPQADGASIGQGSLQDFHTFTAQVAKLDNGGVFLNIGSAVILPEVFLKAVSVCRNLGYQLNHFVTANFDFIQHYRPLQNVVKRPTRQGGKGYAFTGHHELMIPLLAAAVLEEMKS